MELKYGSVEITRTIIYKSNISGYKLLVCLPARAYQDDSNSRNDNMPEQQIRHKLHARENTFPQHRYEVNVIGMISFLEKCFCLM